MDSQKDLDDLLKYYSRKGEYDKLLARKVYSIMGRVSQENREKAIEWLLENREKKFGLDVPAIRQALTETGTKSAEYVPAEDVKCDACGMEFKYNQMPTDEDRQTKGIFDLCPRCGFQVCWTVEVDRLRTLHSLNPFWEPEWYTRLKTECAKDHAAGEAPHYSRKDDEAFTAAQKKAKSAAMVESLARSKRAEAV